MIAHEEKSPVAGGESGGIGQTESVQKLPSQGALVKPIIRPGISSATLDRAGIKWSNSPTSGSICIPYHTLGGSPTGFCRYRLPKTLPGGQKYWQPEASGMRVYIPWGLASLPGSDLILVEGEFKSLALVEAGVRAIALPGLNVYVRDESGERTLIDGLSDVIANLKPERLLFLGDNDTALNFEFARNAIVLAELTNIPVSCPRIPLNGPGKGADDCRAALNGSFGDWWRGLVATAEPVELKLGAPVLVMRLLRKEWPAIVATTGNARDEYVRRLIKFGAALFRHEIQFAELSSMMSDLQVSLTKPIFKSACRKILQQQAADMAASKPQIEIAAPDAAPVSVSNPKAQTVAAMLTDARPKIQLPCPNRPLSEFAKEIGAALATKDIYRRGNQLCIPDDTGTSLSMVSAQMFRSWAEQHCIFYKVRPAGKTLLEFVETMPEQDSRGALAAPQFLNQIRRVDSINPIPMPVLVGDELRLLSPGYDSQTQTLTTGNLDLPDMGCAEAVAFITDLFSEFGFAPGDETRSRAVAIAGMISLFGRALTPPGSLRPCFIYLANAEGAGKSLCAKLAMVPVLGRCPGGVLPRDDEELRKALLTTVLEASPVIFLDNIKRELSSPALEAFLSMQTWRDRILGASQSFTGTNNATVFATGNACTVSPDMRRRALFCELFMQAECAEVRVFKHSLDVPEILERRVEILGALWAMIRSWHAMGMPSASRINSSFPQWSRIIGGITEAAGFGCPLELPMLQRGGDSELDDMRSMLPAVLELRDRRSVDFRELVGIATGNGLFSDILGDNQDMLSREDRTKFSRILTRYDRRIVGNCRLTICGKGHSRTYLVEQLTNGTHDQHDQHDLAAELAKKGLVPLGVKHHADHADHVNRPGKS